MNFLDLIKIPELFSEISSTLSFSDLFHLTKVSKEVQSAAIDEIKYRTRFTQKEFNTATFISGINVIDKFRIIGMNPEDYISEKYIIKFLVMYIDTFPINFKYCASRVAIWCISYVRSNKVLVLKNSDLTNRLKELYTEIKNSKFATLECERAFDVMLLCDELFATR